jgi:hypothetical protein
MRTIDLTYCNIASHFTGEWLLHKGIQDENCHGQRNIQQINMTLDKQAKHCTQQKID